MLFVTGKGGTGKTSVSVALARALARRGKRVALLEVDAPRPTLPSYFGGKPSYEPVSIAPRIDGANVDFYSALQSYVESVVPMKSVVGLVLKNKVVRLFLGATPGARELVLLSRIWELSQDDRWQHLIVDLPASGHALALFRCPFLARGAFERGPLRQRADDIVSRFGDPEVSGLLFVAIPGEMPVNETLETRAAFEGVGLPAIRGVVLNRFPSEVFDPEDEALLDLLLSTSVVPGVAAAAEAARLVRRGQHLAIEAADRLAEGFGDVARTPDVVGTPMQVSESLSLALGEHLR